MQSFPALSFLTVAVAGRFDCPALPHIPAPQDISQLHPSHVSLVMAVGDSMTAAFSARGDLNEARDISYAIGKGEEDQLTLPWLLEQYSARVEGQSTKAVFPANVAHLPDGDYHPKTDGMNFAESSGAAHRGSVDQQWGYMLEKFGEYQDFDSRWKVLTYFMYANDIMGICDGPASEHGDYQSWEAKTEEFLVNVTSILNNTYVNLLPMLDLSHIHRIQQSKVGCKFIHEKLLQEGGCIDRGTDEQLAQLDENIHFVNARVHKFAADWQAKLQAQGRTDIAVVAQGLLEGIGAQLDWTFLSKLDCFHPSALAHEDLAVGLWNSMLCTKDRTGRCGQPFTPGMSVTCPDDNSVFYTGADVAPAALPSTVAV